MILARSLETTAFLQNENEVVKNKLSVGAPEPLLFSKEKKVVKNNLAI
jgi:hypothetical protein